MTPGSASATVTLGQAKTVQLTYTNNGTLPLHVVLGEQDGGFTPTAGQSSGAKADLSPVGSGWTKIASYPTPIENNAVAYDPASGDVYSVGGYTGTASTASGYVYNPNTRRWTPIASAPQPLEDARAAFVDGTLHIVGGWAGAAANELSAAVYTYNPGSNTWSQVASLPQAVVYPGIAVLDGQLYAIGGCTPLTALGSSAGCDLTQTPGSVMVNRYDPGTNAWTQLADYPIPIGGPACAGIDGEIACAGGEAINGWNTGSAATYLYNPSSNTWSQGADMPYPNFGMAYSGANGELQVAGGATTMYGNIWAFTRRVSQYDPQTNTWTALATLKKAVSWAGSSCGMYMTGGASSSPYGGGPSQPAQVLPGYDQCDGAGDTGWLSASPGGHGGFDLAPGASVTVRVRLNSAKLDQPGTYQAAVYARTNTPYPVQVTGVRMVVNPPAGWRLLSGTVTDTAGTPIAGTTVQVDTAASSVKSGQVNYTLITGADGTYQWWLDPNADDPLQVIAAKDGYIQQVTTLKKPSASVGFTLNPFPSVPY